MGHWGAYRDSVQQQNLQIHLHAFLVCFHVELVPFGGHSRFWGALLTVVDTFYIHF